MKPVLIKEVIGRAEQGLSSPLYCKAMDDTSYYVKNTDECMHKEWICAHLAQKLGLPVAGFALVEFSSKLVELLKNDFFGIKVGYAFGSQEAENAVWLEPELVKKVPADVQRAVVAFDWWVRNDDRCKSNPNLLWQNGSELVVIDHNNAFSTTFDARDFVESHVFAEEAKQLFSNFVAKDEWQASFQEALACANTAYASAPEEWQWYDEDQTIATRFNFDSCLAILHRCLTDDFWNIP